MKSNHLYPQHSVPQNEAHVWPGLLRCPLESPSCEGFGLCCAVYYQKNDLIGCIQLESACIPRWLSANSLRLHTKNATRPCPFTSGFHLGRCSRLIKPPPIMIGIHYITMYICNEYGSLTSGSGSVSCPTYALIWLYTLRWMVPFSESFPNQKPC